MSNAVPDTDAARRSFDAGLEAARAGRLSVAVPLLERAAGQGSTDALMVLADMFLHGGADLEPDPKKAVHCLERAAAQGLPAAAASLAAVHYAGFGVAADDALAARWLRDAIQAGHRPSVRTLGLLLWLHGPARHDTARAVLRHAAHAGDPFAQHALGRIALLGGRAGDREGALQWLRVAAAARLPVSARWLAELGESAARPGSLPPQADAKADAAALAAAVADIERALPSTARGDDEPARQAARIVWTRRRLLDPLLCDYLTTTAMPWLERSMTNDPRTGQPVPDAARTSWGMNYTHAFPDLCVAYAERRIAAYADLPLARAEPLAVLRYEIGQEYREHHDYMQPDALATHPYYRRIGQRVLTVITYIGMPRAGGGTTFPLLGLTLEPEEGMGVKFRNVRADGTPDEDSLHAGLPVAAGEKWVCTLWFRERDTRSLAGA
jgi:TPR repeat protein